MPNNLQRGKLYKLRRNGDNYPKLHLMRAAPGVSASDRTIWKMDQEVYNLPMLYVKSTPRHGTLAWGNKISELTKFEHFFIIEDKLYNTFSTRLSDTDQYFEPFNLSSTF